MRVVIITQQFTAFDISMDVTSLIFLASVTGYPPDFIALSLQRKLNNPFTVIKLPNGLKSIIPHLVDGHLNMAFCYCIYDD